MKSGSSILELILKKEDRIVNVVLLERLAKKLFPHIH